MPKPTILSRKRIAALCQVVLLVFIAVGQSPVVFSGGDDVRPFVYLEVIAFTLLFIAATLLNIYRLIPRLLLRGRYFSYMGILLIVAVLFVLIAVLFEGAMFSMYRLTAEDSSSYSYFLSNSRTIIVEALASLICYYCSLAGTSLIVFLRYWNKSGERLRELEQSGIRAELETARTKVDAAAMLDVFDRAAAIAVSIPEEAARMLKELGQSLRRQLYESEHRHVFQAAAVGIKQPLGRYDRRLLNFIVDGRYRWLRNMLFVVAALIAGGASVNPRNPFSLSEFAIISCSFLAVGYFNVYVLLPRFVFNGRLTAYFAVILSLIALLIAFLFPADYVDEIVNLFGLFVIFTVVRVSFLFAGTTAIVLFQHWARNERRIAALETETMRAELEQLQNQINPHFLFNMLNNILVLIRESTEEAVVVLRKMSGMLRYQLNDSAKKTVPLKDDIRFLTDLLNLEKIRRDRFDFSVAADSKAQAKHVPPLLFIPFVENAVKHSADAVSLSYIRLRFAVADDGTLHFTCCNSKPLNPQKRSECGGLGLANVRRRLALLYHNGYALNISEDPTTYTVKLSIKT